jgi:CubicO group peptidase (beta-lactamase class C family)
VDDAALLEHVTAWIERGRDRFAGPGIVVGITDRERTLGALTLGASSPGEPLRDDHLFLIASVSKSFTAALVMQEAAAGHLALDDPVTKFLPWFTPRNPSAPIELQHLLTHTAGIATGYDISGDAIEELLLLREEVVASVPGTHHVYSNAGYKALGLVLEHVTGRPWWELARERILEPLGMTATEPVISNDVRPKLAQGWVPPLDDRPWHPDHGLVNAAWYESYTADGTIASNARDLTAYVRMYLNDGGEVLRKEDVDRMTAGDIDDPDTGSRYGFGLWVLERDGHRLVGHSGSLPGFRSMILFDRERGFGAAMMTNGAVTWDLRVELLSAAIDAAAADEAPALPPESSLRTYAAADRAAGTYTDGERTLTFEAEDDGLVLVSDDTRDRLIASGDALVTRTPPWDRHRFTFEGGEDGGPFERVANGSHLLHREGPFVLPAPPAPAVWSSYVGRYRAYGIEPMHVEVLERAGRLFLLDEHQEDESELIPLDAGRFRVGAEPWQPGRARFVAPVGEGIRRLVLDGAVFVRVP